MPRTWRSYFIKYEEKHAPILRLYWTWTALWCKKSHHMVLNFLSLKTHMTLVHRSQKPRTSDAMSTRRPCSSPLNLPDILDLLASHLRITNYGGLAGLRRSPQSSYFLPSTSSSFSSSSFSFSLSYKQSCISMTDVPRQKWADIRYRIIKNLSFACIGSFLIHVALDFSLYIFREES